MTLRACSPVIALITLALVATGCGGGGRDAPTAKRVRNSGGAPRVTFPATFLRSASVLSPYLLA